MPSLSTIQSVLLDKTITDKQDGSTKGIVYLDSLSLSLALSLFLSFARQIGGNCIISYAGNASFCYVRTMSVSIRTVNGAIMSTM